MKRVAKIAVLGLALAAASSVTQITRTDVVAAGPEEKICVGESGARVRAGSNAREPNEAVSPAVAAAVQKELDKQKSKDLFALRAKDVRWVQVPVWFHVIHDGKRGNASTTQLKKQLAVLDATYQAKGESTGANTKVNFYLGGVTRTKNPAWFNLRKESNRKKYEAAFKKKLRKGGDSTLNLYTVDLGDDLLGWATWPWDYKEAPRMDGVVVHYGSLPGGSIKNYNLGYTAAHETGHWFGLYHTFGRNYPAQGGCEAGDRVADTPDQSEPTTGCPLVAEDSCPDAEGTDPIHNFMDYAYDVCMTEFTAGQSDRMRATMKRWRP